MLRALQLSAETSVEILVVICFSLAGSSNPLDDLIGDVLNSTDSSNLLGGFELNSTAIPQSQQMQRHLMINSSTSVPSLRPTAGGMVSPGMIPQQLQQPHTPPPPSPLQTDQTQPPHLQPQFLSPMNQTHSFSSSLQPATTTSTPQSQTQHPETQHNKSGPHGPVAHLTPPSTSQLYPQTVTQPGSSTQQGLVSESLIYVMSPVFIILIRACKMCGVFYAHFQAEHYFSTSDPSYQVLGAETSGMLNSCVVVGGY